MSKNKKKDKDNVIKLPVRSENGLLEITSELLELARNKNLKDLFCVYRTEDGMSARYWAVDDLRSFIGELEYVKFEMMNQLLYEEAMYEDGYEFADDNNECICEDCKCKEKNKHKEEETEDEEDK